MATAAARTAVYTNFIFIIFNNLQVHSPHLTEPEISSSRLPRSILTTAHYIADISPKDKLISDHLGVKCANHLHS